MKNGFIGTGNSGAPICANFHKHGHEVVAHDRDPAALARVPGAVAAASAAAPVCVSVALLTLLRQPCLAVGS